MNDTARRVLLCDDEVHILRAASMKLSRAGLQIETASDGQMAWEMIQNNPPHLLVTDYQMPRMNGLELCRKIRGWETTRNLPIVLLSAKGYEFDWDELALELWLTKVMVKPFSPRELLLTAQQALGLIEQTN